MAASLRGLSKQTHSADRWPFLWTWNAISEGLGKGPSTQADCAQYSRFSRVLASHFQGLRVLSSPWWGAESGKRPQGEKELSPNVGGGERTNTHVGGSSAWGVTREDSLYPKLKLEVPLDALGVFSKVWRSAERCLGVSRKCGVGEWMGREDKRDGGRRLTGGLSKSRLGL